MLVSDFDYLLPAEQIAQRPLHARDASRMLVLHRDSGQIEDRKFEELPKLLRGDEVLVINNARVIPARLFGRRVDSSSGLGTGAPSSGTAEVEILLSRRIDDATWEALVRPGRKMRVGQRVQFGEGELEAEVVAHGDQDSALCDFRRQPTKRWLAYFQRLGHVPLPPYIDRADEPSDRERYQTVFASRPGAIAAPTAGLHFTPEILERIRARGVEICELTLHVGLGTFQPIRSETLEGHSMHSEEYEISPRDCRANRAGQERRAPNSCSGHHRGSRAGRCGHAGSGVRKRGFVCAGKRSSAPVYYAGV